MIASLITAGVPPLADDHGFIIAVILYLFYVLLFGKPRRRNRRRR